MSALSSNIKAIGTTAGLVAIGAGLLLASRPNSKATYLVKDHSKIAREVAQGTHAASDKDDPGYDYVVIGGGELDNSNSTAL